MWEESHYYPIIGLSTFQYEVEKANIEYDGFIADHFGNGNELEQELMPNAWADVEHELTEVHFLMEHTTLLNIKASTDGPPVLIVTQPRFGSNYLLRLR